MCKKCYGRCAISCVAAWGFFALLLTLLGVYKPGINAIWLTLLISVAMISCPVINPHVGHCCQPGSKKPAKVMDKTLVQKKK